jgi:hypothetical protein
MPKSEPAVALLKRLQKIEQAHGRLAEIATRIRAQAETIADLVRLAQAHVSNPAASSTATRGRSAKASPKRSAAKRSTATRGASKSASGRRATSAKRATAATPAAAATAAGVTRRAPRKAASRSRKPVVRRSTASR